MSLNWAFLFLTVFTGSVLSQSCLTNPNVGTWVPLTTAALPSGALEVGYQDAVRSNLFLCRVAGRVGKYYQPDKHCYVEDAAGSEARLPSYEVLTNAGYVVWVPVVNKQIPCNAIVTGGTSSAPTYTGRGTHNNFLLPGNIVEGVLRVPYAGMNTIESYQVLTAVPQALTINRGQKSRRYKTNGSTVSFRVKSEKAIRIDLGVNSHVQYQVTIGALENKILAIGTTCNQFLAYTAATSYLSADSFVGFWIRWTNDKLEVGSDGTTVPLLTFSGYNLNSLNTVQFYSISQTSYFQIADLPY